MRKFTAYDLTTGNVLYCGEATDIQAQAEEGVGVVEGHGTPLTHRVVDGKLRMIPKRERDARLKERTLRKLRGRRDRILRDIDWRFGAAHWASPTEAEKQAWQDYRQALLDLPETIDLDDPVWPVPPQMNKEAKT
jgi:hypothetical protein